ncbi:hypothetical protein SMSRO_SF030650 [Spiroplasma poulsonii]|uniref:DUF3688 domain-containing protein n=1 Tax=Spiroplasma poulsonii TaxID=2138 RepID=A0A2P6F894_9MOLU|nr:hypothetical protein SMSRO_SF030650 [Spiroplasma poulsonii]
MRQSFTYPNINFTVYRWDGINEPIIPTINKNTGEITDWQIGNEQNFFVNVIDEVIKENIRVQQGGGSNYEKLYEWNSKDNFWFWNYRWSW